MVGAEKKKEGARGGGEQLANPVRVTDSAAALVRAIGASPDSIESKLSVTVQKLPRNLGDMKDPATGLFCAGKLASASLGQDIAAAVAAQTLEHRGQIEIYLSFSDVEHAGILNKVGLGAKLDWYFAERAKKDCTLAAEFGVSLIAARPGGDEFVRVVVGTKEMVAAFFNAAEAEGVQLRNEIFGSESQYQEAIQLATIRQNIRTLKLQARADLKSKGAEYKPESVLNWARGKLGSSQQQTLHQFETQLTKMNGTNNTPYLAAACLWMLAQNNTTAPKAVPGRASTGYVLIAAGTFQNPVTNMMRVGEGAKEAQLNRNRISGPGFVVAKQAGIVAKQRDGILIEHRDKAEKSWEKLYPANKDALNKLGPAAHFQLFFEAHRDGNLTEPALRGDLVVDRDLELVVGRALKAGGEITVLQIDTEGLGAIQNEGGRYDIGDDIVDGHAKALRALSIPGVIIRTKGGEVVLLTAVPKDQIKDKISSIKTARDAEVQKMMNEDHQHRRPIMEIDLISRIACDLTYDAAGQITTSKLPRYALGETTVAVKTLKLPEAPTLRKLMALFAGTP